MSFKYDDTMIPNPEEAVSMFTATAQYVDPEALSQDLQKLLADDWVMDVSTPQSIGLSQNKSLILTITPASKKFRVLYAVSVMAEGGTKIGYAEEEKRPGDLNQQAIHALVTKAVEEGQAEVNKWSDALAQARAAIA